MNFPFAHIDTEAWDRMFQAMLVDFKLRPAPTLTRYEERLLHRGIRRMKEKSRVAFLQEKYDAVYRHDK